MSESHSDEPSTAKSKPQPDLKQTATDTALAVAKGTQKTLWKIAILVGRYSKEAYAATRAEIERRKASAAAKREARINADFQALIEHFGQKRPYLGADGLKTLEGYPNIQDVEAKQQILKNPAVARLKDHLQMRVEHVADDAAQVGPDYRYSARAEDFLCELDPAMVNQQLRDITRKYKVSSAGHVASAAMNANRNAGLALLSIAGSAQVGAHNGAAKRAFTSSIRELRFFLRAGDLEPLHRTCLRLCTRIRFLNGVAFTLSTDDLAKVRLAHFCLVYANGHAKVEVPGGAGKFSGRLYPEFHNGFRNSMLNILQAIGTVQDVAKRNKEVEALVTAETLMPYMRQFSDDLPKGPEV